MRGARILRAPGAAVLFVALCGFAEDKAFWQPKGPDPEMDRARNAAHETLPKFWVLVDARPAGFEDPTVKVGYPTRHGGVEFLWIGVDAHKGSTVRGEVLNTPEDVADVHAGQKVSFRISQVVDWGYFRGGVGYGQYTTRVVLKRMPPADRWEQGRHLAPAIVEPGFD